MPLVQIRVAEQTVIVDAAAEILPDLLAFFPFAVPAANGPAAVSVGTDGADGFRVTIGTTRARSRLARGEALELVRRSVTTAIVEAGVVALRASAACWMDKAVLIAAPPGTGKSSLLAWFIDKGFAFVADDLAVLDAREFNVAGLAGPLAFQEQHLHPIVDLPTFRDTPSIRSGDIILVRPELSWLYPGEAGARLGLIMFPRFVADAPARIAALSSTDVAGRLAAAMYGEPAADDPRRALLARVGESTPAFAIEYGSFASLDGVLVELAQYILEGDLKPAAVTRFLSGFPQDSTNTLGAQHFPIPVATDRRLSPKMTIGMATYDDYDGVYFTIQALRMYHPEIVTDVEFLVVDNHPDGRGAEALKRLEDNIDNYRYVPFADAVGTASAKNKVFSEAAGQFVLCIDCHVFIVPGAVKRLLAYFVQNSARGDLLQGPLLYDNLTRIDTHFAPRWRAGMWGDWATDPRGVDPDAPPFDIPMQGMGVFACRRDAWPGFNPHFRGFGGEEGYIHEKIRRGGARTLCLPFLRWMHRFNRPFGPPYRNTWEDRCRNYVIGFRELGMPTEALEAHFTQLLGAENAARTFRQIRDELDYRPAGPSS